MSFIPPDDDNASYVAEVAARWDRYFALSIDDVSFILHLKPTTISNYVTSGKLKRTGKGNNFTRSDIEAYLGIPTRSSFSNEPNFFQTTGDLDGLRTDFKENKNTTSNPGALDQSSFWPSAAQCLRNALLYMEHDQRF